MLRRYRYVGRHRLTQYWTGTVFLYGGRPDRTGAIWVRLNEEGKCIPIRRRA